MNQIVTIVRRNWLLLLGLNSIIFAATFAAVIYAGTIPPIWKAGARLNMPTTTNDLNADLGTLGNVSNGGIGFSKELNPLQLQNSILTSDAVIERVLAADPEKDSYSLGGFRSLFEVTPQDQSTIISIEAEGSSPELSRQRIATLIEVYQQRLNELRRNDAEIREQFARQELQKSRKNLVQVQEVLSKFRQATGLVDSDTQTKGLVETINGLKSSQASALSEAQANEAQAQAAAAQLRMAPQQAMDSLRLSENKEYQAIRDKLTQVDAALAEARGTYTSNSPQVQSLLSQRQELQSELNQRITAAVPGAAAKNLDTTLGGSEGGKDSRIEMIAELARTQNAAKGLRQQASEIQEQINKLNDELNFISANQSQLTDLQRKYDIAEGSHKGIAAQIEQAKTNPFNAYPNVQTLDGPNFNLQPEEPKRWLIVLGGIVASIFGSTALILYRETSSPLVTPKDLLLLEFPILVSISRLRHPHMERDLGAEVDIDFQRLATAVSSMELQNRRLMVTSSTAGEGKTTITLGLALGLVNLGYRVLVVDSDLRQAELSQRLGYPRARLDGNSKQVPVPVYPGLDLLPAPFMQQDKISKFFARGSFDHSLSNLQDTDRYDYVLLDSAPVSLSIETTLMSAAVRNVLFLVRPDTSDRHSVMDSIDQLRQHNAQIKGLVVNGVEVRPERYQYGRYRELMEAEA